MKLHANSKVETVVKAEGCVSNDLEFREGAGHFLEKAEWTGWTK